MGAYFSTARPGHTCDSTAQSKHIRPPQCSRCNENAYLRFEIEAAIRTKAWCFPGKYKLETHNLGENPNWIEISLGRPSDPESVAKREKVLRDLVEIYCEKDTLPRDRPKCVCKGERIEMKEFQKLLASRLGDTDPQVHLSFEPIGTPVPKDLIVEPIWIARSAPEEEGFVVGDDSEGDGEAATKSKGKERVKDNLIRKRKSMADLFKLPNRKSEPRPEELPLEQLAEPVLKPETKLAKKLAKKSRFTEAIMK